ncbi:polyphosphate kinase 2 family protein [Hufsiella ginkgonis]|uniref:Polyphosphate kinase 2 family protein n=1 Tax=Hufsiella ginkgonis TaxID=2695274 RepID=A0A7K1XX46_9SPHI|nr:polyphosphate kinase 2 family protein [Hufsiella ginkgonis]MXV15512.1 polyphosphate kinase 2 family protein [Hufsiella ginkgonis]
MDSWIKKFRVAEGAHVSLAEHATDFTGDIEKEDAVTLLNDLKLRMSGLQEKLYAGGKYSLLLIFQAMDAAGKDSTIMHVMSGINPQGCQVYSFKQPSLEESKHDFLWRHNNALPGKGSIGIHNRSHYESVLVTRVHPEFVLKENHEGINKAADIKAGFWKRRYQSIVNFEKHISRNGTVVVKFFLHVSKAEQKERFLDRIADPLKNWKFSAADLVERERWDDYMDAYERAMSATSTSHAPWYVIPADKKWFARIAVARCIVNALESLDLELPKLTGEATAELERCREQLLKE